MCEIVDVELAGAVPDAMGQPTAVDVAVRATDCPFVDVRVRRGTQLLFTATGVPVVADAQLPQGLARRRFVNTPATGARCGETLRIEVACATDASCARRLDRTLKCKVDALPGCPTEGPALSVVPPLDQVGDCVPAGPYTVTVGGMWPPGTTFDWASGELPPGSTTPTGDNGATFMLEHPAGSPRRVVVVVVTVPTCSPRVSVVLFPPAADTECPTVASYTVSGPASPTTGSWSQGDGEIPVTGLVPGDHTVRVEPTTGDASYVWFRDGIAVAAGDSPQELPLPALAAGTTTVAALVQVPCCSALLVPLRLTVGAAPVPPPAPDDGEPGPDPDAPVPPPPSPPCPVLSALVGIGLVAALVALVVLACLAPLGPGVAAFVAGMVVALGLAVALMLLCGPDPCQTVGVLVWALKWSIALGLVVAVGLVCLSGVIAVVVMGMTVAGLVWWLVENNCPVPPMLALP